MGINSRYSFSINSIAFEYSSSVLLEDEYSKAMEFMENEYLELIPICINLRANSPPFHKSYLFDESLLSAVTPPSWYRSLKEKVDEKVIYLSLIHISEPTRLLSISYAVFCLKKKKK